MGSWWSGSAPGVHEQSGQRVDSRAARRRCGAGHGIHSRTSFSHSGPLSLEVKQGGTYLSNRLSYLLYLIQYSSDIVDKSRVAAFNVFLLWFKHLYIYNSSKFLVEEENKLWCVDNLFKLCTLKNG